MAESQSSNPTGERPTPQLEGLSWVPRATSHMACLEACVRYLGLDISPAWLFGGTGQAFFMNVDPGLCPSGPSGWNFKEIVPRQGKNIGLDITAMCAYSHEEGFAQKQEAIWHSIRQAIDQGHPCYGWHWEFIVINGYDEAGYLLSGRIEAPASWRDFRVDFGLETFSVKPCEPAEAEKAIRDVLGFATEIARVREGHPEWGCFAAYDKWADSLESDEEIAFDGAGYHAAIWSECRTFAHAFLREANARTDGRHDAALRPAIDRYETIAQNLQEVAQLFPPRWEATKDEMTRNAEDMPRRREAAELVRRAREAEEAGIAALDEVLKGM